MANGQYGPEALINSGGVLIGATVTAAGYVCSVDTTGNLTVTGPAADAVALHVSPLVGGAFTITVPVPALPSQLETSAHASGTYGRRARGTTFAILGDSIAVGYPGTGTPPGSADLQLAPGWFNMACFQSKGAMAFAVNAGVSGNTSTQALARVQTDVVAFNPAYCIVAVGENDEGNSITAATSIANLTAIYAALEAANIQPVAATVMGKSSGSPTTATLTLINEWIRANAQAQGYHLLDFASFMLNPATNAILAAYTGDGTHPNAAGYKAMSDYVLSVLPPRLTLAAPPLAVVNTDAHNMLANACFLTDTNSDGIPDGWVVNLVGTSTTTPTLPAAPTGSVGNFFTMSCTVAGTARSYRQIVTTGFSVGDKLMLTGRIQSTVVASGGNFMFVLGFTGSTNKTRLYTWSVDLDGVFRLPVTVPTGATQVTVEMYTPIAAGGSVAIGQVLLRNLTVLGLAT